MMNADIVMKVHGRDATDLGKKIAAIDALARTPQEMPTEHPGPVDHPVVDLPDLVAPYFDIGDATGKAGETIELSVEGGCRFLMSGFHIGGGCGLDPRVKRSGYGKFQAIGVSLGEFLRNYLREEDLIHDEPNHQHDHFWSIFNMMNREHRALPEEWWEYAIGFFSIDQERDVPPTTIPSGTEIFRLHIKILDGTPPGEYDVTCINEWYFTNSRPRRRGFLYSGEPSGGYTKLDLQAGKITVTP